MPNQAISAKIPPEAFTEKVKLWSNNAAAEEFHIWEEQLKMLSDIGELITPDLSLEQVIATIYSSVNQLMDAYQFAVGLFDEKEMTITYKGIIENSLPLPDLIVDASLPDRLAPWCILHDEEIFINDMQKEYRKYVTSIPNALVGTTPNAALYVPLHMEGKVAGLITVRTIHKNVYQKHHLYILKTLGTFVIRSLALAKEQSRPFIRSEAAEKNWRWNKEENLPAKSKKQLSLLTAREKEVLLLMVSGMSNKEIAERLFVSAGTIKTHTLNIYIKLDVSNRTSAILKAIKLNWFV